jgi:hypothetical protein
VQNWHSPSRFDRMVMILYRTYNSFSSFARQLNYCLNAAFLAKKQQIPILYSFVWQDRSSYPQSIALEASMLTITLPMRFAALRRKNKDWLARNQNNVSEWSDISTQWLLLAHLETVTGFMLISL